jgi:hypothetical protein
MQNSCPHRHDGHGTSAFGARDLERHASQATSATPYQHDVIGLDHVRRPAHEHAIRGGSAEQEASGLFPRQTRGFGNALMALSAGELTVAPVVCLVAPDPRALGEHWIAAGTHPRIVGLPPSVDDHLVADSHIRHAGAFGPHDPGTIAAARVKILRLPSFAARRSPSGCPSGPHVVEVDPDAITHTSTSSAPIDGVGRISRFQRPRLAE